MSAETFREAVEAAAYAWDLIGPHRGPCGLCRHPDARHRSADAITEQLAAGEDPLLVADDYLIPDALQAVLEVALFTLAADHRLHGVTRPKAAGLTRQVYADLYPAQVGP